MGHTAGREHAIVIGSSMAGLLTARVLCQHFQRVTVVERDALHDQPEARRGQPQTRHTHVLLARGMEVLDSYFPRLQQTLTAEGAVVGDLTRDLRWYAFGGYRLQHTSGIPLLFASRPFLEWHLRRALLHEENVLLTDGTGVVGLSSTADQTQVTGVRVADRAGGQSDAQTIAADLVVDTTGRGSRLPQWLVEIGYPPPPVTTVQIDVGYATRLYRARPGDIDGALGLLISPAPPDNHRLGVAFPLEGERWIVGLSGWGKADHPPTDDAGFLDFARTLAAPDVHQLIQQAEPLGEAVPYTVPNNLWRRYDRLRHFPTGLLVLGDAFCAFNPVYGQGMTSAALQAVELDRLLGAQMAESPLWPRFFQHAARVVQIPWQLAVSEDFRFATTRGPKPLGTTLLNAYGTRLHQLTHTDPEVYREFARVFNLMQLPTTLFHPRLLAKGLLPG